VDTSKSRAAWSGKAGRLVAALAALSLALTLGLSLVASAAPVPVRFYYPVQVAGPLARVIDGMVEEFNRTHPDIQVIPVYSGNYDETMQKAQTAAMSGNPPDVAVLLAIDVFTLTDANLIVPLDELAAKEPGYLEDFHEGFLENSYLYGRLWGIPFQRSVPLFYYNRDMFRAAGLDPNRPPETWDELVEYARRLTVRDAAGRVERWGHENITEDTWMIQAFALQAGGTLMSPNGDEAYFTSPQWVEALQFMVDLANKHQVMPRHRYYGDASSDFVAGRAATMYNSSGSLSFVRSSAKFDFGVSPLPGYRTNLVPTGGGNFYIFRGIPAERQRAAWEFIKWMTTPENAARWSIASGYIPVRKSAYETAAYQQYLAQFPQAKAAREQLAWARKEMAFHNNQQVRELLLTAQAEALDEVAPPAQILARLQTQVERILRPFKGR